MCAIGPAVSNGRTDIGNICKIKCTIAQIHSLLYMPLNRSIDLLVVTTEIKLLGKFGGQSILKNTSWPLQTEVKKTSRDMNKSFSYSCFLLRWTVKRDVKWLSLSAHESSIISLAISDTWSNTLLADTIQLLSLIESAAVKKPWGPPSPFKAIRSWFFLEFKKCCMTLDLRQTAHCWFPKQDTCLAQSAGQDMPATGKRPARAFTRR